MVSSNTGKIRRRYKSSRNGNNKNASTRSTVQEVSETDNAKMKSSVRSARPMATGGNASMRNTNDKKLNKKKKKQKSESEDLEDSDRKLMESRADTLCEDVNETGQQSTKDHVLRPPTSFSIEKVMIRKDLFNSDYKTFLSSVSLNSNMVIENLTTTFMPYLLFGDQIYEIDGVPVLSRSDIKAFLKSTNSSKHENITISVIRVWNYSCPSVEQLTAVGVYEKMYYFIVRLHRTQDRAGLVLYRSKKRLRVGDVRPNTDAAYGLLPNDSILEVQGFQTKTQSGRQEMKEVTKFIRKELRINKVVEIFVERAISSESSPNPSIGTELMSTLNMLSPSETLNGTLPIDPPIEADAVEISLRELVRMQTAKAAGDHPLFSNNSSILKVVEKKTEPNGEKPVEIELYDRRGSKKGAQPRMSGRKGNTVNFRAKEKEVGIESDIPDSVDLKKVDAKSGLAAFVPRFF